MQRRLPATFHQTAEWARIRSAREVIAGRVPGETPAAISHQGKESEANMPLNAGDLAPDFKLNCATGDQQGEFQLSSYRGKNVVLFFYALDFTPV
jgi:AhpC/TSA family